MIPELGHIILITHLILCLIGGTMPLLAEYTGRKIFQIPLKKLSFFLLLLISISFPVSYTHLTLPTILLV